MELNEHMRNYLGARRRAKQADAKARFFMHGPKLRRAAINEPHARDVNLNEHTYMLSFKWGSCAINYAVSTGTLLVIHGPRRVLRTGVTPEKMLELIKHSPKREAFPMDGDLP